MKTFHKIETLPDGRKRAVFCIPTKRGDQFMCTGHVSGDLLEEFSVVEVDAGYFLEMWRNDTYEAHLDVSQGNPKTWVQDRKFPKAEKGFSYGETNPVPLAMLTCAIRDLKKDVWQRRLLFFREYMGAQVYKRVPYVTFSNGITRTIWLLTYGAEYFPVMCGTSNAELLQLMAGRPEGKPKTIRALLDLGREETNAMLACG